METIDNYRIKLKEISDYAFGHGVQAIGPEQFKKGTPDTWERSVQDKFYIACHDGFKTAQRLLIKEINKYQSLLREETVKLKEFRRTRDKIKEKEIQNTIRIIGQRLSTLSHIADGIAWQLIGGQIHIARRFNIEEDTSKFLDSSNIEHAIKVAEEINKNPKDFALISDLTNFVQIGDLLVRHDKNMSIMELKEGKVNDLINEFFEKIEKDGSQISDSELKEKFDDTTIKQIKRMQRQKERGVLAAHVINNDKGIDPVSGENILVSNPTVTTEYYHDILSKLYGELKEKIWAYTVVDSCLHIGMYKEEGILMSGFAIEQILKIETENYIVIDWLSITRNVSEPIFAKPFPSDFIINILTGEIKIILGLNIDNLIFTFNVFGLKTRWLSTKETAKRQQQAIRKGIFVLNKRGIVAILPSGQEIDIYGGIISKILYDNIKPSNIALTILSVEKDIDSIKNSH